MSATSMVVCISIVVPAPILTVVPGTSIVVQRAGVNAFYAVASTRRALGLLDLQAVKRS